MGGAQFNWGQGLGWTKLYTGFTPSTLDTVPSLFSAHHHHHHQQQHHSNHFGSVSGPSMSHPHEMIGNPQSFMHHTSSNVEDYSGYEDYSMDCAFDFSF